MPENLTQGKVCVVVGASHAGVNFAFALRKEGWEGEIILFDRDPALPYHRPPLSKTYLSGEGETELTPLKSAESYQETEISLRLGVSVIEINRDQHTVTLSDGSKQPYDKLVLATGARPFIPPIKGIDTAHYLYPLRTVEDVNNIRMALAEGKGKSVVIIGGGYIGLETAASLKKLGSNVKVLELEERILARVTAPVMSQFFYDLHQKNGVEILTGKMAASIETENGVNTVVCADGSRYPADVIVVGCGIRVNQELAEQAGLAIENGIRVDSSARSSDEDIYAIGDCTFHHNPHYDCFVRLESVQNAVDQAKVAAKSVVAAAIANSTNIEKDVIYDTIPWFWSDQYDVKLQMVGLSTGYNQTVVRKEESDNNKFSVWYFKDNDLLAVDAVNNAKAYVLGTKFIKGGQKIDKAKLGDPSVDFKPANLLVS